MINHKLFLLPFVLLMFSGTVTVYVSSSSGDDTASGLSAREPVRTIRRARELGGDIRLKCGDVFYEYLRGGGFSLKPYSKWGDSSVKPVISGFRIIPSGAASELWSRGCFCSDGVWYPDADGTVWRLDLMADGFEGYVNNVSENDHKNIHNIGAIYDPVADVIYGRKQQCPDSSAFMALEEGDRTLSPYHYLEQDMDFYQPRGEYRYLYVLASEPSLLMDRELWLSSGADAIRGSDFQVSGVKFTGWGKTAVRGGSHITVTDCEFDIIGGSVHEYEQRWIRFGNGVEFWADQAVDDDVSGCLFTRVFDTATTIQGPMSGDKESACANVRIHNNIMRGCRQDFEVWIRSADGLMPQGCSFTDNVGYDSGNNGFSTSEYNNTHLLHYILSPYRVEGIRIENNVFYGGGGLYYANSAMDNVIIGRNVYHCTGGAAVINGLFGSLSIPAPVREGDGCWKLAEGLDDVGNIRWGYASSEEEAAGRFEVFINALTGGSGFVIEITDPL